MIFLGYLYDSGLEMNHEILARIVHPPSPQTSSPRNNRKGFKNIKILANKKTILSGQIIATSHDLTPNGGLVRDFPLFQGNLGW